MPQEFQVVRCYSCQKFQGQQVKKAKKWSCKVCGEKQSYAKIYGQGSGKDCRLHVQKLNALAANLQRDVDDQFDDKPNGRGGDGGGGGGRDRGGGYNPSDQGRGGSRESIFEASGFANNERYEEENESGRNYDHRSGFGSTAYDERRREENRVRRVNSYGVFEKDEGDRSGPSRNVSSPSNFRVHERLSRPSLNDGDGDGFEEDDDEEFDEEELSRLERESTRQNVEYQKRTNVDAQDDERVEYQHEDRQERHDVDRRSSAHNEGQTNTSLTPSSSPRSSDSASTFGVASREEYMSSAATTLRSPSVADHRQRHDAKRSGNRWSKYLEEDEDCDQKENENDVKRRKTSQNFFLASKNESSVNESEEIISNETKAYSRSRDGFGERDVVAAKHTEPEAQPKLFPDMTEDEWNEMFDEF